MTGSLSEAAVAKTVEEFGRLDTAV